jgi:hypothetical protein
VCERLGIASFASYDQDECRNNVCQSFASSLDQSCSSQSILPTCSVTKTTATMTTCACSCRPTQSKLVYDQFRSNHSNCHNSRVKFALNTDHFDSVSPIETNLPSSSPIDASPNHRHHSNRSRLRLRSIPDLVQLCVRFAVSLLLLLHFAGAASPPLSSASTRPLSSNWANQLTYFEDTSNELFTHLAVNPNSSDIYVGGVNKIYQLDSQLQLKHLVSLGPRLDSPDCPVTGNCPSVQKKLTNYYNKVLLVDAFNHRLISCGSLFQVRLSRLYPRFSINCISFGRIDFLDARKGANSFEPSDSSVWRVSPTKTNQLAVIRDQHRWSFVDLF